MSWFLGIIAALLLLDAWRLRQRVSALLSVEPSDSTAAETYTVVTAPGIHISDETVAEAAAWAHSQQLDVLDLIPGNMATLELLSLAQIVEPETYRDSPFIKGRSAGHALLIKPHVLERSGLVDHQPSDPVEFLKMAERVKRYASHSMDMAVAPNLAFHTPDPTKRKAVIQHAADWLGNVIIVVQPFVLALLAYAPFMDWIWGTAALVAFQIQPLMALGGHRVKPSDIELITLLRLPIECWRWLETIRGQWQPESPPDPVEARRSTYDDLLKDGLQRFFEPRRETCPLCSSTRLKRHLSVRDQYQNKPGQFYLDRCDDCAHIFQNPRLSIEGLNFYYKDFYDGLGEDPMEGIFGHSANPYYDRARMLEGRSQPKKWLDVGGGHGHFCCAATHVWPNAQFDCLDLSESVDEAVRRRWVTHGYRGLFPEMAKDLEGQYDVVSMSHYLEHVRDPESELAAAATALRDGGHLLIEVPDPNSVMGRIFGRFWLPWFQPQHQHFVSVDNLNMLFQRNGFEAVEWHRGKAHQVVDFVFAVVILFELIAPDPNRPWQPRPSALSRFWNRFVWIVGSPLAFLAWGCDQLFAPVFRRPGLSNTYRVLAQKKK